jgi:eukaryotic-like serine/threonine-protein kinase
MPASAKSASRRDWKEILALLDIALELDSAQHAAWLAALPTEQARLSPMLKELLESRAEVGTGDFMRESASFALPAQPAPEGPAAQSLVGPYRLLRELGQGGMASVWLAERADGLLDRRIALKLPHVSWGIASFADRMARERNILGSLTHPNIARLYDAGIAADGRPFLALEYVDGQPVDVYASAHGLGVRARVELILQVARAVAHAHARLVVHRDLKPSNILVDAAGQAHLLDFGIAKLVDPQPGDAAEESQLTQAAGGRALTPDYASPEQIRGETIGTASDVYSLGVVAYELLAGAKPYRLRRDGAAELAQAIASVDVPRASSAATNPGTSHELQGDLDAILNKALKKEVAERYASVEAFAQDLERHLANQPVQAQPDSPAYRVRKFLRRNKVPVAAAVAVIASLVVGLSLALWQAREALLQAERAQRVKDFIGTVFATADPHVAGKAGGTVRDLLDAAAARIDRELQREPAVAAELLGLLSESYRNLGEPDRALSAAQRADGLAAVAYPESDPMRPRLMRVLAQANYAKGQGDEARRLLHAAVAMQRRQGGEPAELGQSLLALARATLDQGKEAEAVALTREAVQRLDTAYGSDHALTIEARGHLSNKLMVANQPQEALQQAERAVEAARRTFATPDHPALVAQLSNYAYALNVNGRAREAREQWQTIVAADRKIFNPRGPQVSEALVALGHAQTSLGELKDALASFEEALAILEGLGIHGGGELAIRHFVLGRVALFARQDERALSRLDEAIAIGSQAFGADSVRVRDAGYYRAEALLRTGRLTEAQSLLDRRIAEDRASGAPGLVRALRIRGLLDQASGDAAAALARLQEADALARQKRADGPPGRLAQLHAELGRAQLEAGQLAEAEGTLLQAVDELHKLEPTPTPQQAEAWLALGRVRLLQGRTAEALLELERADTFWRAFEPEHALAGEAAFWLGRAQAQAGDTRAALAQLARAKPLLAASSWPVLKQLAAGARRATPP